MRFLYHLCWREWDKNKLLLKIRANTKKALNIIDTIAYNTNYSETDTINTYKESKEQSSDLNTVKQTTNGRANICTMIPHLQDSMLLTSNSQDFCVLILSFLL